MISFIICSINPQKLEVLLKSIAATVGNVYEIISYDNTETNFSIAHVYNQCAAKAQYENLIFVHEDMEFFNHGWDSVLIEALCMPKVGIVGLAGSKILTKIPSYWHAYQGSIVNEKTKRKIEKTIVVDGFFIATTRTTFLRINFDENISKYHAYDTDICLAALREGFYNYVITKIGFVHHSHGTYDESWIKGTFRVFEKYAATLPLISEPTIDITSAKKKAFVFFLQRIIYAKDVSIFRKTAYFIKLLRMSESFLRFLFLGLQTIFTNIWKTMFKF